MRVSQTGRLRLAGGTEMVRNVDWYTNWLYDFRDFLDNRQSVFPHCSLLLEANRHPDILDDSVPLKDVRGETVYRKQMEPDDELRKTLSQKYLTAFHASIKDSGLKQDSTGPSGR